MGFSGSTSRIATCHVTFEYTKRRWKVGLTPPGCCNVPSCDVKVGSPGEDDAWFMVGWLVGTGWAKNAPLPFFLKGLEVITPGKPIYKAI